MTLDSGCYQLRIKIKSDISIVVGSLGICRFEKGDYIYSGSAMKNLSRRIERHRRSEKKLRWHIDYLLTHQKVELIEVMSYPSEKREECDFNQKLIAEGAEIPIRRFGSSDCRICPSHLLRIRDCT